ncbi:MAG: cob(I)yrinic acid a,c-diamide adenosyltransferase [Candidatus Aenigmatarchaeota archaeon]
MGYIYIYTGTGAGKTTNALGLALRSLGHKHKVVIIQFMKWWKNTGEYKIRNRLKPHYQIYLFGRPGWFKFDGKSEIRYRGMRFRVRSVEELDRELAKKALDFAKKKMLEEKPHILVLDEINLAVHLNILSVKEVLEFLDKIPERTQVVLTGRYAPKELIDRADFVNEIVEVKSPKEFVTTKGIQY